VCIFLTFIYRVVIYKRLFVTRGSPVVINKCSFTMIITTYVEVYAVLTHYSWMSSNVLTVNKVITVRGVFLALVVVGAVTLLVTFLINISYVRALLGRVLKVSSTSHYYKWFTLIPAFKTVESFLVSINTNSHLVLIIISRKMSLSYNFNRLVLLVLLVILVA